MRYFVFGEDGNKYGPADVSLLNDWAEEGRLLPRMILEEEGTHHRVPAASIQGIDFYSGELSAQAGEVATFTLDSHSPTESEKTDIFLSFCMVLVTLCLAPIKLSFGLLGIFTAVLGIVAALKAKDRGHSLAASALAFNLLALLFWAVARLYFIFR